MSDPSSHAGATRLKHTIEEYWAKRGRFPKVEVIAADFDPRMRATYFVVRSDMRNGRPLPETRTLRR